MLIILELIILGKLLPHPLKLPAKTAHLVLILIGNEEYGKQCVLQAAESEGTFYGDPEIMLEIMENLVSNALRYGKQQITIMVNRAQ